MPEMAEASTASAVRAGLIQLRPGDSAAEACASIEPNTLRAGRDRVGADPKG